MQAVILAGGLGERLRPITERIPKAMVNIRGRPFLEYQINLLKNNGISDIVLCVGYLGEKIKQYFGDGRKFGVNIKYSEEKDLLGTAGALKNAEPLLEDIFFLTYGDAYLILDYKNVMNYFRKFRKLGLMVVYKNFDRYGKSNTVVEGNLVKYYSKKKRVKEMVYIDFGVSVLRKKALEFVPPAKKLDLEFLFQELIKRKQLLAYETTQRFYEIGNPSGLREFRRLVSLGKIMLFSQPA
ncbi:MAG: nucleotidyltransferase family protein [Candidatus Hadarchaeales archaeon]